MMRHHTDGMTVAALAKEAGVHTNQLRRAMIKAGIEIKSRSESMRDSFAAGHSEVKGGFTLSEEHKDSISKANKGRAAGLRNTTNNVFMDKNNKDWIHGRSAKENSKASKKGSKFEKVIVDKLIELGYNVGNQVRLNDYKIDIFIAAYNLAIEIDGISHRKPVFGAGKLQETRDRDKAKDDAMKQRGMSIVRIMNDQKGVSRYNTNLVIKFILETIKMLETTSHLYRVIEVR